MQGSSYVLPYVSLALRPWPVGPGPHEVFLGLPFITVPLRSGCSLGEFDVGLVWYVGRCMLSNLELV